MDPRKTIIVFGSWQKDNTNDILKSPSNTLYIIEYIVSTPQI